MNTGVEREREEDVLYPVITLGIEHVLLIVKGPGLSPSLTVSQWFYWREVEESEADWPPCHLTSLTPCRGGLGWFWSEITAILVWHIANLPVCLTGRTVRHRFVLGMSYWLSVNLMWPFLWWWILCTLIYMLFSKHLSEVLDWFISNSIK